MSCERILVGEMTLVSFSKLTRFERDILNEACLEEDSDVGPLYCV